MLQKRQGVFDRLGGRGLPLLTLAQDYEGGKVVPLHYHDRDQLVYASHGVMTVRTGEGAWVVPTHRAVWIPAGIAHSITMSGTVAMRTLYLRSRLAKGLPTSCCVINVSSLLKELILHVCAAEGRQKKQWRRHLTQVILDQLETIQMVPLRLPNPSDPRAVRVAETLLADPSDRRPLAELCRLVGASKRTVERLFQEEVGMTLGKWRQQLRLMEGMRLLAEGAKVTHAALEAGYSTPSAFIAMFGKALGTTPASYFRIIAKGG